MPNKNGKGPRKQSPRPSVKKGGLGRGGCKTTRKTGRGRKK